MRYVSYHRIVVKLGTTLLTSGRDHLDLAVMATLVGGQIAPPPATQLMAVSVAPLPSLLITLTPVGIAENAEEKRKSQIPMSNPAKRGTK